MRFFLKIVLLGAIVGLFSCEKISQPSKDANWWIRRGIDYSGIKYIEEGYNGPSSIGMVVTAAFTYNRNGTCASKKYPTMDEEHLYSYNDDGSLAKDLLYQNTTLVETVEYEYNNTGRYVPRIDDNASVSMEGLTPNLSKITYSYNGALWRVEEFSFDGDILKIVISTYQNGKQDSQKEYKVEYKGAYPYKCQTNSYFIESISYQENGMFDTVIEGYVSSFDGDITRITSKFVKGRNDKNLFETIISEEPERSFVTRYSYNEHGDYLEITNEESKYGKTSVVTDKAEYEYDSRGNWVKRRVDSHVPEITIRNIEYY